MAVPPAYTPGGSFSLLPVSLVAAPPPAYPLVPAPPPAYIPGLPRVATLCLSSEVILKLAFIVFARHL